MTSVTQKELKFIEEFSVFGKGLGLPKSTARVLGFLIISTPDRQTAVQIQQALGISSGSVSMAITMLIEIGLVERIKLPSERRIYYRLVSDGFVLSVQRRFDTFKTAEAIAEFGLEITPDNPRLIAMKRLYAFLDSEMQEVANKLSRLK